MAALLFLLGLFFGAGHLYLNSSAFQQQLVAEVTRQVRCEVHYEQIQIRHWGAIDLVDVRLASDHIYPRDFMKVERLRLHYNVFEALIHQKIVLETLQVSAPSVKLDLVRLLSKPPDRSLPVAEGVAGKVSIPSAHEAPFIDEVSGAPASGRGSTGSQSHLSRSPLSSPGAATSSSIPPPRVAPAMTGPNLTPPSLDLRRVLIEEGTLALSLADGEKLFFSGVQINATFSSHPAPNVMGSMVCPSVELSSRGHGIEISEVSLNFLWQAEGLEVPHLSARFCGGGIEGKFKADSTKMDWPFEISLSIEDLSLSDLMNASEVSHPLLDGNLRAETKFLGSMRERGQFSGRGQARILNAKLVNTPYLGALADYLNRPDFRNLPLQTCDLDFILLNGVLDIPRLQATSSDIEVQGEGWIKLQEQSQEFLLKVSLSPRIVEKLPPQTFKGLAQRPDQYWEIPFRTWGSLEKPQTDPEFLARFTPLASRIWGRNMFDRAFRGVEQLIQKKDESLKKKEEE